MDIERVNAVLVKAIVGFQEAEIDGMIEATAGGYKVPSPAEVAAKGKKKKKSKGDGCKGGGFSSFSDCVSGMECKGHKDPEGFCGAIMFGGKKKSAAKKKKDDEDEE